MPTISIASPWNLGTASGICYLWGAMSGKRFLENPGAGHLVGGKYRLMNVAGKGGMATVWRAETVGDLGFRRSVAVKQMHAHLAEQQVYVDMFVEEARVGAELHDANIPQVHDFVADDTGYYIVMEYIDGIDLGGLIRVGARSDRCSWEFVTAIGLGMLRALASAHEREHDGQVVPIVHRDVSPHNVLLTPKGMVKLIDFGLALTRDRGRETTEPGLVKGKMSYLAPEIVMGKRPTPASDQFAVGSTLWEALVGRKLFDGNDDMEVYRKLRDGEIQPLRPQRPDIPRALVKVIDRSLSHSPAQRFPDVRTMAHALGNVLKQARASKTDLHTGLGRAVLDARERLHLGELTSDPSMTTPIEEVTPAPLSEPEKKRGLRHWLPFFKR